MAATIGSYLSQSTVYGCTVSISNGSMSPDPSRWLDHATIVYCASGAYSFSGVNGYPICCKVPGAAFGVGTGSNPQTWQVHGLPAGYAWELHLVLFDGAGNAYDGGLIGTTTAQGYTGHYTGAWSSATAYAVGDTSAYNGNYWICLTANTNSAPTTSNANWQITGPTNLDNLGDGSTNKKVLATEVSNGIVIRVGDGGGSNFRTYSHIAGAIDTSSRIIGSVYDGATALTPANLTNAVTNTGLVKVANATGNVPYANTSSEYQGNFDSSGTLKASTALTANVANSTSFTTDTVLTVVIGASPYPVKFYISNGTSGTAPKVWFPSAPTSPTTLASYGTSTTPIACPSPLTSTTISESLYFLMAYKPGSTGGVVNSYSRSGSTNASLSTLQTSNATSNGWTVFCQKDYDFSNDVAAQILADGYAITFTTNGGNTYFTGGSVGSTSQNGGGPKQY